VPRHDFPLENHKSGDKKVVNLTVSVSNGIHCEMDCTPQVYPKYIGLFSVAPITSNRRIITLMINDNSHNHMRQER